jgi:hypothetical protein
MTSYNNLYTVTLSSAGLTSLQIWTNYSTLYTVTTSANVPTQGKQLPGSTVIKCKWE